MLDQKVLIMEIPYRDRSRPPLGKHETIWKSWKQQFLHIRADWLNFTDDSSDVPESYRDELNPVQNSLEK
jgi:hypothetical protein